MTLSALFSCLSHSKVSIICTVLMGLVAIATVVGCSPQTTPTASSAKAPPPAPTATVLPSATPKPMATAGPPANPPMVGSMARDFEIKLFQGSDILGAEELRLSDVTGRPLVLNFWARFCGPCWSEMPELQDFYEEYGDEVQLLGVDLGQFTGLGSPKDASKLLDALGVTYPAGYTDDDQVVRNYRVSAMPTTIFITAEGEVFRSWTGSIDREQLEAIARLMLGEESGT